MYCGDLLKLNVLFFSNVFDLWDSNDDDDNDDDFLDGKR